MDEQKRRGRVRRFIALLSGFSVRRWIARRRPFRLSYWVVFAKQMQQCIVIRKRLNPGNDSTYATIGFVTLDGPFASQEDAATALAFWNRQYTTPLRTR